MGSREVLTLCAAINSVHWLLTRLIRKKNIAFAYRATDERHKDSRKIPPLAIFRVCTSWFVAALGEIPPQRQAFSLWCSIMIFFLHICVNEGADQLCGNRTARTADERFCCRFIGSTLFMLAINEISYI